MANLNKVMLIGRLTRDPEVRTFANGGKVAKFGLAVNNRRRNASTNEWEDEPVFVDIDVFNRGEQGRQADLVEQSLRKGQQVFIEGHLRLDQWTSQDGQKRSRLYVRADNFQFLQPREGGSGDGARYSREPSTASRSSGGQRGASSYGEPPDAQDPTDAHGEPHNESDIPF